jgi:hypothetical protein
VDALRRTVRAAGEVGIAVILVDAKNENAQSFYRHYGFQPLPDKPLRLILPIGTAVELFETEFGFSKMTTTPMSEQVTGDPKPISTYARPCSLSLYGTMSYLYS